MEKEAREPRKEQWHCNIVKVDRKGSDGIFLISCKHVSDPRHNHVCILKYYRQEGRLETQSIFISPYSSPSRRKPNERSSLNRGVML